MIETKRTVTTLDGKQIELTPGGPQIWELQVLKRHVDPCGSKSSPDLVLTAHVTRDVLEKCGKLPPTETKLETPTETPEDLLRQLLESIGVVFE